ncbi:MAG: hypothetical protein U9O98_08895 [Asgard group archaeon]|nr:hypothetical protein [Asgard group archaeon]
MVIGNGTGENYHNRNRQSVSEKIFHQTSQQQKYPLVDLGFYLTVFNWSGEGLFQKQFTKSFSLENEGPTFLILDIKVKYYLPDDPGYYFKGSFNGDTFEKILQKSTLASTTDTSDYFPFVIPLPALARRYHNNLTLIIEAENDVQGGIYGELEIQQNAYLLVGENQTIEKKGKYETKILPSQFSGKTSLIGIDFLVHTQFSIANETLLKTSDFVFSFNFVFNGKIDASFYVIGKDGNEEVFFTNKSNDDYIAANISLLPGSGSNFLDIKITVFGESIWSTKYDFTISESCLEVIPNPDKKPIFEFGDITMSFFQWPSSTLLGICVLLLWLVPVSVLKFKDMKKGPYDVDLTDLDIVDDEDINLGEPEGIAAGDDDDDFEDTYDFD